MKLLSILLPALLLSSGLLAQNYDESKIQPYKLPPVLQSVSGKKITTAKDWQSNRRPEVLSLFEENVYGVMPKKFDRITFHIKNEDPNAMNGKATLKQVEITVFNNNRSVLINLVLFIPNHIKTPVPAFLLINNRSSRNTSPERDTISGFWPAEQVIASGYAIAAFHVDDAAPDDKNMYQNGVLKLYPDQIKVENGMKAIGCWAWAASRVMDYFEKDKQINASEISVVGHSRGGKASLWAAAQDTRFAMCITNCSGNTGAALSRRRFGETIEIINNTFPHWFNNNYKKYNNNEDSLPVDQHMLISLIAPRPVYITNASEDSWADPKGTFMAGKEAESVYQLFRLKSALPASMPAINTPVIYPPLGYHIREGKHDLTAFDWTQFVRFADRYFKK